MSPFARTLKHLSLLVAGYGCTAAGAFAQTYSSADAYALPTWFGGYTVDPMLSVGETVPRTVDPLLNFQMIGIPDESASTP